MPLLDMGITYDKGIYRVSIQTAPIIENFFKSTSIKTSVWGVSYYTLEKSQSSRKIIVEGVAEINGERFSVERVLYLNRFGFEFHPENVSALRSVGISDGIILQCSSSALYSRALLNQFCQNMAEACSVIKHLSRRAS